MKNSTSLLILLISLLSYSLQFSSSFASPLRFNVEKFGAKGDGIRNSTNAFQAAWKAACGADVEAEVYVPKGKYLLYPITFEGKCKTPKITVRIDGMLLGPRDYMVIANADRWIEFIQVDNLVIHGGTLLGRGKYLWKCQSTTFHDPQCPFGGTMLVISQSSNVWINNVTSIHSQGFHMYIEGSQNVNVFGVKIIAPGNSPNTDGLHVQSSIGVTITSSSFRTGDDCISLSDGSQNIWIQNVWCGPGHGISIGSLGASAGEEEVRNVTAKDIHFRGTQNGFRIKTWAKPFAVTVRDIHFVNAVMTNVNNPIIIDQFYCPGGGCPIKSSFAKISNVEFNNINGTSSSEVAIKLNCSPKFPCRGLSLQNVKLRHSPQKAQSDVKNAVVHTFGVVEPSVVSKI